MSGSKPHLNTEQKEAVEYNTGPLLIIAGAGTGKTTVIVEKIKHLIHQKLALPEQILGLTFTEKSAYEMEERIDRAMPYGYTQMWIMTFHSFCDRILRNESVHIGLDPGYRLMTESEAIGFMRKNLFKLDLKYFRPLGNPTKFTSGLVAHFSRLADEDITPEEYIRWTESKTFETKEEEQKEKELAKAYKKYEELKVQESKLDFSNLISSTLKLFRARPNVLDQYRKQFKYILVDEFQDTNISQNELVKLLVGKTSYLTVVADDDQSIYKWRGAAISNVIQFRKNYPTIKIVTLTQNYRSTQAILDAAYTLIQYNNPDRLEVQEKIDKRLRSSRRQKGTPPELLYVTRIENEAEAVAKKIAELVKKDKYKYSDFAILLRANNHSEPFVRALYRLGIPYQFLGPGKLFRQPEIKELIAYLKFLTNIDDSTSFYKVLTMEQIGLNGRDVAAIVAYAKRVNLTLFEAAEQINKIFVSPETREKIARFVAMIHRHLKLLPKESAGQILYFFLEDMGMLQKFVEPAAAEYEKSVQNLAKFFDKLKSYEVAHEDSSVFAVTDWIDLSIELGESPIAGDMDWTHENSVNILTVHSSKGLEFPVVFVVNLVANRFPTTERHEQLPIPDELIKEILPEGNYHLEEERRLFYVAATRAKDRLFLTAANYYGEGKREKKISPFVIEMIGPEAIVQTNEVTDQLSILDFAPPPPLPKSPETKKTEINYLSFSQIDTFRICPLHYKLRYIYKIPALPTASQSFGTTLHETLKRFTEALIKGIVPKHEEDFLLELYQTNWIKTGYTSREHEENMKKRGAQYLKAYLKSSLHKPDEPPLALEQAFIFSLIPGFKLGGRIDRIDKTDDGIEIIDYKTTDYLGKKIPTDRELKKNLQLSIYALAAKNVESEIFKKNRDSVSLSLYLLDKGVTVTTTRTQHELETAVDEVLKTKREIESSDFKCSGSPLCLNCEYKLYCES